MKKTLGNSRKLPSLRLHKHSGRGFVELNGQRVYVGKYGEPETRERYVRDSEL